MDACDEGGKAFDKGYSYLDNPYNPHTQPDHFNDWSIGFMEAEYEMAEVA